MSNFNDLSLVSFPIFFRLDGKNGDLYFTCYRSTNERIQLTINSKCFKRSIIQETGDFHKQIVCDLRESAAGSMKKITRNHLQFHLDKAHQEMSRELLSTERDVQHSVNPGIAIEEPIRFTLHAEYGNTRAVVFDRVDAEKKLFNS